jgi:hypothetical protein
MSDVPKQNLSRENFNRNNIFSGSIKVIGYDDQLTGFRITGWFPLYGVTENALDSTGSGGQAKHSSE